jgi:hypothetical protein
MNYCTASQACFRSPPQARRECPVLARKIEPAIEKRIQAQLRTKKGMLAIAKDLKVGTGTVQRVKREMEDRRPLDGAAAAYRNPKNR